MKYCCVPGCRSKSNREKSNIQFYALPAASAEPLKKRRREKWLKAINATELPQKVLKNARVCSKHFVSGRPATNGAVFHIDWVPSVNVPVRLSSVLESVRDDSVQNIITNLPEVIEEFDVPEYIILDKYIFNEKKIESDLIHKYITNPVCDENGYYRDDHDYLGLPIIRLKTDSVREDTHFKDHNYSTKENPACLYVDLRHFCNICQCNNKNLFSFNTHMMLHTLKNDVTCSICDQRFLTTTCLNNHISSHTTICDICRTEVPVVQIRVHQAANKQQKRDFNAQSEYKISNKERVNFCIFCMKEFNKRNHYFEHLSKHKVINMSKNRGKLTGDGPNKMLVPITVELGT